MRVWAGVVGVLSLVALLWVGSRLVESSGRTVLGSYSTTLQGRSSDQLANIRRAARLIDARAILPGKEFSMAQALGPTTSDRGWKEARAYVGNAVEDAVAGGICQVSSTLYNAAVLADLEITERHAHSRPIASVPCGRDATVALGVADLRFRNNRATPVNVRAEAAGARLVVSVVGAGARSNVRVEAHQRRAGPRLIASLWRVRGSQRERLSVDSYLVGQPTRSAITAPPQ
ncbi:MAG: VanW family protein [Armatimonadetes bacterium]|nr:VanW family protein [Armatimonadota bacterium]